MRRTVVPTSVFAFLALKVAIVKVSYICDISHRMYTEASIIVKLSIFTKRIK